MRVRQNVDRSGAIRAGSRAAGREIGVPVNLAVQKYGQVARVVRPEPYDHRWPVQSARQDEVDRAAFCDLSGSPWSLGHARSMRMMRTRENPQDEVSGVEISTPQPVPTVCSI
jgi:hypothetical protein